ncbi:hypothetical protein TRFO_24612 [Tritrichomonas foetus]|uniref:Uncharacterized protein n=1 Tax=Tritrichomonas foetus TaxID=1144522 RepID=A0A1J4K8H5_9EUKA|nr:hypothetical protein TRFO_24612 [Tritrichomonas foetus]|eukprot:OHT07274.1 hypothetical protein TRFO_24612 [Tritrichomonas foetus]
MIDENPLSLLLEEISEKKKEAEQKIRPLREKKESIQKELQDLKNNNSNLKAKMISQHESELTSMKSQFIEQKKQLNSNFDYLSSKIYNKSLADDLLFLSKYEEEKSQMLNEIKSLNQETEKSIENMKQKTSLLLLPFRDSIEFDKMRIVEIKQQIEKLTDKNLVINKVDKTRKGPRKTHIDAKIDEKQGEIENAKLMFDIQVEKIDKSFHNQKQIAKYQLTKLKQKLNEIKQKQDASLLKIENLKSAHKNKMIELKMTLIKLTDPKPMKVVKKKKDQTQKLQQKKNDCIEMQSLIERKTETLKKLKERNQTLIQSIRKLNWCLSNPTDVTYNNVSKYHTGLEI